MRHALTSGDDSHAPLAPPVTEQEFADLMDPLVPQREGASFAVAVSGGPDSMALAFCLRRWAGTNIRAAIVDHRLRPESEGEAQMVKQRLAALGIAADILTWEHPPVAGRVHVTARKARYALLADYCRQHGLQYLLLGHQREDQAETILMRLAKGSGVDGLAGMSVVTASGDVPLLRPFLNMPKERLIATCRAAQISYVADPSNVSDKYARGRLRKVLPLLAEEGLTIERLIDLGARAAEARDALDEYALAFLGTASGRDAAGAVYFNRFALTSVPYAVAERAFIAALQAVHPEDYAPERASLQPLLQNLRAETDFAARTLQGCLIATNAVSVSIAREYACITDSPSIAAGQEVVWDDRWRVRRAAGNQPGVFSVRSLGNSPHELVDKLYPSLRNQVPQGRIRAGLPAFWDGDTLVGIPEIEPVDNPVHGQAELLRPWPQID